MSSSQDEIEESIVSKNILNLDSIESSSTSTKNSIHIPSNKPSLPPVKKPQKLKNTTIKPQVDITSDDISELTDSDYNESIFTSRSDVRSYRDKLRDRFRNVKKQSGKSIRKNKKLSKFKGHASNILSLNSCIELIKIENEEIENKIREKSKIELSEDNNAISRTERYHFFCENSGSVAEENNENENLILNSKSENVYDEIIGNENQLLWIPPRQKLSMSEKNEELAVAMDEGIYMPKKPKITKSDLYLLEQRLFAYGERRWFNSEGDLIFSENPCGSIAYRSDDYSTDLKLETVYEKATINVPNNLKIVTVIEDNILEIHIQSIKFKHHSLFSPEHLLQEKLINFYDKHRELIVANNRERIEHKLSALRKAKINLENNASEAEEANIFQYTVQIKELREKFLNESRMFRENIKNILYTWKGIKNIREHNGYSNTTVKLNIRKENMNYDLERELFEENLQLYCNEIIEENMREYNKDIMNYKEELVQWKKDKNKLKPTKPNKNFDVDDVRNDLKKVFKECLKPPGEPQLNFSLTYDNEVTKAIEDLKEISRRNTVNSTKIFFRILCNDVEIFKTKPKKLIDTFVCFFDESFSLKLSNIPKYILIEIYEQATLIKRKIGDIKLKIPKSAHSQYKICEEIFSQFEIINHKHTGIGCGQIFEDIIKMYDLKYFQKDEVFETSGILNYSIGWSSKVHSPSKNYLNNDILNNDGSINIENLNDWTKMANLDPEDPKNSVIFNYLKSINKSKLHKEKSNFFRLNAELSCLTICDRNELDENIRFQLLELRDKNEPEFVGMIVPNRIKEIPMNIFSNYKRRLAEENHREYLLEDDYDNEINSRRSYGRKYLKQMHIKIFQMCRNAENNISYEDIVNEKAISFIELLIKMFFNNIINWFRIKPKVGESLPRLKPYETETLNIIESAAPPKIRITLVSGLNIPTRIDYSKRKSQSDIEKEIVLTVIEISCQNVKVISKVAEGKNPIWNEDFYVSLESINTDYLSPNSLNEVITINIFDFVDESIKIHLGSIKIPLSAICHSKMEGWFLVKNPSLIFGYQQSYDLSNKDIKKLNPSEIHPYNTYLNLKINMELNVPKLMPDMESLPTSEPSYLKQHILEWNLRYNEQHPNRKFSALPLDCNGKTTCATRFLKSLEPPQLNSDEFDVTPEQCARYISMIPFTDCNKFYQNMWLSTEHLIKLGVGSIVDHAISLTCFLMTLNLDVWLLLGFGIPHGPTAYVLLREFIIGNLEPRHYIYEVTTGHKYNIMDVYCPLQKIYCVINDNNVWANNQGNDDIKTTRFDFSRHFDWTSLFNQQITAPTYSIQKKLIYVTSYDTQQLQYKIEKKLRKKITKLRVQERTTWNHYLSNAIKNAMTKFESSLVNRKIFKIPEIIEYCKSYKVNGCLISLPFHSVYEVIDKILVAKLHKIVGDNGEFASGVYIHPYPNQVLAVWIAVLAINK